MCPPLHKKGRCSPTDLVAIGVELFQRRQVVHVGQRLQQSALRDIDNCDEACPGKMERVLIQAVQFALLDVAGGTLRGVWRVGGGRTVRW